MSFASRLVSPTALVAGAALVVGIGYGCGGTAETSTGTFNTGGKASTGSGMATGGEGGSLFQPVVGSTGSGMTTTTGTGGSMAVCDGTAPTTGPVQWAVSNTNDGAQNGLAVATDVNGNIYVTGSYAAIFNGSTIASPGTFTIGGSAALPQTQGASAMFVAKLGPDGTPIWVKGFAAATFSGLHSLPRAGGRAVVVDQQGNVYVTGEIYGRTDFGGQMVKSVGTEFSDVFILKLDGSGNPVAALRIGDPESTPNGVDNGQTARGIALLKSPSGDQIAVVGNSQGTLDIGGGKTSAAPGGSQVAFVAVFSAATLTPQAVTQFGDGSVGQAANAVAFDKNQDLLVTGNTAGAISFPNGPKLTPTGAKAAFVAKLKSDLSGTTWAKLYGSGSATGEAITSDSTGTIFIAGNHQGDIDFGDGVLGNPNGDNVYVARLEGGGNAVWAKTYGNSMSQQVHGITVDSMGRPLIAGEFTGKIDFGGGELTSAGNGDIFVAKLDTHGCQIWAKTFGDTKQQAASSIALDSSGNAIITGSISGAVTFGSTTLTVNDTNPNAISDMFVAKFGP
ncbi:Hypothetical protein A7982_09440 [Minicystis rosea]|nr:Hypothetical protein A7982_09440 [Minicystis rosea]